MAITKELLDKLKINLENEEARLIEDLADMKKGLDFGSDTDHLEEETDESEEAVNVFGVERVLKEKLGAVRAALQKIKNGTYGICEKCGNPIEEAALRAAPESAYCVNCKKEQT